MAGALRTVRESFAALEEREFRLYWIGQTGSAFGDSLIFVALAFAVLQVTGSATDLGLVFAAFALPRVIFTLVGGVWADRLPRRALMVGCDVIRGALDVLLAVLLVTGTAEIWHLLVLAAVMGTVSSFFVPSAMGLVPQLVQPRHLQQANALMGLSESATQIFGPLIAGLMVATIGPGWAFGVDGASFFVSAAFLLALRLPPREPTERSSFVTELIEGWREVRSRTWVWASMITFALSNVGLGAYIVLGPVVANSRLGGATDWGLISSAGAVGGLIGGALALRWKPERPLVPGFLVMMLPVLTVLTLVPPLPTPLIALSAVGFIAAIVISNAFWNTLLQQHIPANAIGRVSSYDWMVSLVFQPIAFAVIGPLSDGIGLQNTLLIAASLTAVPNLLVLLVPSVRNLRRLEQEPAAVPETEPESPVLPI